MRVVSSRSILAVLALVASPSLAGDGLELRGDWGELESRRAASATEASSGLLRSPPRANAWRPHEIGYGASLTHGLWAWRFEGNASGLPSLSDRLRAAPGLPAASWQRGLLRDWFPSVLLLGAIATAEFALDPPSDSRWSGRNGFDGGITRFLGGSTRRGRAKAGVASDYVLGGLAFLLVADWILLRDDYPIADRFRVDTRWFLANTLATQVAKLGAGRERPLVRGCTSDRYHVPDCSDRLEHNTSFYSGHASIAATFAGLVCSRSPEALTGTGRRRLHALSCGGAVAGALATGVLRIVAEQHFATDVIAGWFSGALFGFYLPTQLDERQHPRASAMLRAFTPIVGPKMLGVQYRVEF